MRTHIQKHTHSHSLPHTDEHVCKHLLFICRSFWNITHLSSKYVFLATAWMDAGTRGKPWTGKRWRPYEVLSEFSEIHLSFMQQKKWLGRSVVLLVFDSLIKHIFTSQILLHIFLERLKLSTTHNFDKLIPTNFPIVIYMKKNIPTLKTTLHG